jgi:membrane protease subunit HflK
LAEGRAKIEADTQSLLQTILNSYRAGIEITQLQLQRVDPPAEVIDAFRDVQAALADQARLRNEAESYRNSIVPAARGDAVQIEQQAQAYRLATVARAQGDAARFLSVYRAFKTSRDVTLQRLYLETMEEVLKNSH